MRLTFSDGTSCRYMKSKAVEQLSFMHARLLPAPGCCRKAPGPCQSQFSPPVSANGFSVSLRFFHDALALVLSLLHDLFLALLGNAKAARSVGAVDKLIRIGFLAVDLLFGGLLDRGTIILRLLKNLVAPSVGCALGRAS